MGSPRLPSRRNARISALRCARRSRPRSMSNSRLLPTPMLLLLQLLPRLLLLQFLRLLLPQLPRLLLLVLLPQLPLLVLLLVPLDLTQLSSQPELPSVMLRLMPRLTHNCCLEDNLLDLLDVSWCCPSCWCPSCCCC